MGYGITRIAHDDGTVEFIDTVEWREWADSQCGIDPYTLFAHSQVGLDEAAAEVTTDTVDTALPQPWVDEVVLTTGRYPYGFVWGYGKGAFGHPVAVTVAAQEHEKLIPASIVALF